MFKKTFLEIPLKRFGFYITCTFLVLLYVTIAVEKEPIRSISLLLASTLFSIVSGFLGHFLVVAKSYHSLIRLNRMIKKSLKLKIEVKEEDSLFSLINRIENACDNRVDLYVCLINLRDYIKTHFFGNNPAAFDSYIREQFSTLSQSQLAEIKRKLPSVKNGRKLFEQYDRTAIYNDLKRQSNSDQKLVKSLRNLINTEKISLRFASFFKTRDFDKNTPYVILGRYANLQDDKKVLTDFVKENPYIPVRASSYTNFPKALTGGSVLVYLFIPPKFYKSAREVFNSISEEYKKQNADIEEVFLVISSIFYDSTYIHIGKNIKYTNALIKSLRQFLYFKTGNERFASQADIAQELLNSTDETTFRELIKRLPLYFYVRKIYITNSEKSVLDKVSSKLYERYATIDEFAELGPNEARNVLSEIIDKRTLRYTKEQLKDLKIQQKEYQANRAKFIEDRLGIISKGIQDGFRYFTKLTSN